MKEKGEVCSLPLVGKSRLGPLSEEPSDFLMVPGHLRAPELPHCFSTLSALPLLSLGMAEAGNG